MPIRVEHLPESGAPQVGITVDSLSTNAVISVQVSWDGGESWHGVRGAQRVTRTGSTFFRDFVPPLNVEAWYRVVVHSGEMSDTWSGALHPGMPGVYPSTQTYPEPVLLLVTGADAAITVTSDQAWVQDPLAPRTAVPVSTYRHESDAVGLMAGSAQDVSRPQAVDYATVEGSSLPVASVGVRQKPTGVPLVLRPLLDLAADQGTLVKAIRRLFETAGQVVIRGLPDDLGLDPVAHVVAPDFVETTALGGVLGYREWRLSATQVRPQSLRVVVPYFTYDQVRQIVTDGLGLGATYADVLAAIPLRTTYLDVQRDPRILTGGAA